MKKIYIIVAGIIDLILLAVIVISAINKKPGTDKSDSYVSSHTSSAETEPDTDIYVPEILQVQTEPSLTYPTETPPAETTADNVNTEPDSADYSTDEFGDYSDMGGTFLNGENGFSWTDLSDSITPLTDLSSVTGGWKAYIVSSPWELEKSVAYLMNINISGSEEEVTVTMHWHYFSVYSSGESGISEQPDTFYTGTWQNGSLECYGDGMITLDSFCFDQGKEYATGSIKWGDGTSGAIALIRP